MMKQKITFQNSKGDNLVGIISNPSEDKDKPIIVLCHGFSSSKDSNSYKLFEEKFNSKGVSTLRFDFYGHGESDGKFEDITVSESVDDALSAIKYLQDQGYQKISLIGSSFGGQAALLVAAKKPGIFALGLRCPVGNYMGKLIAKYEESDVNEWKEQGHITYTTGGDDRQLKLNYSFYEDALKHDGYEEAKKITVPTIIVHGEKDTIVPIKQSITVCNNIPGCRLVKFPESGHRFSHGNDYEGAINEVFNFFMAKIK